MRQRNLKGNLLNEKVGLREAWCFMSELRCEKAPGISAKTRQSMSKSGNARINRIMVRGSNFRAKGSPDLISATFACDAQGLRAAIP